MLFIVFFFSSSSSSSILLMDKYTNHIRREKLSPKSSIVSGYTRNWTNVAEINKKEKRNVRTREQVRRIQWHIIGYYSVCVVCGIQYMFVEWVFDVCIICDFTFFVNANALRHTFLYWYFMGLTCIEPVASVDVFSLSLSLRQTMANVNVEHRQANISHVPNPAIRIPRTSVSIAYARFVVQRYTHILTLSQSQCRMLKASKYFRYNLWKFDLASEWHSIRLYWWRTSTSRYRYISK